jgi:hypothetical protein
MGSILRRLLVGLVLSKRCLALSLVLERFEWTCLIIVVFEMNLAIIYT